MTTKTSKKNNVAKAAPALTVVPSTPTLAELVSGKGAAVEQAVKAKTASIVKAVAADLKNDAKAMVSAAVVLEQKVATKKNEKPAKAPKAVKAEKPAKEKKETVASFIRKLCEEGKDNATIFAAAQKQFGLSDDKKWYPAWYRADMRRKAEKAGKTVDVATTKAKATKAPKTKATKKDLPNVKKVPTKKVKA